MDGKRISPTSSIWKMSYKRTKASRKTMSEAKQRLKEGLYQEALTLLQRTEDNEPEASFLMGVIYFDGLGVEEDMKRGIEYMQRMISMENLLPSEEALQSYSYYNLGMLHFQGIALPKDDDLAEWFWLEPAAMKRNPKTNLPHEGSLKSQTALGMFYSHADHHDLHKAYHWHSTACSYGSLDSEGALGVMFLYGLGIEEDPIRAYGHLLNASSRGNIYAQGYLTAFYHLRRMYHRTVDMGKMLCEHEDLEALANCSGSDIENVKNGVALGHFYLALCYQAGNAVKKDLEKAKSLIQKAVHLCPTLVYDLHVQAILGIK